MTEIKLKRDKDFRFIATNSEGKEAILDGPVTIGGGNDGVRPMEMILMGLAGCSSFDLLVILKKQKQVVNDLEIIVKGERADTTPAVFTKIEMLYKLKGNLQSEKVSKALTLSVEKYCSVAEMLNKTADISYSFEIIS